MHACMHARMHAHTHTQSTYCDKKLLYQQYRVLNILERNQQEI